MPFVCGEDAASIAKAIKNAVGIVGIEHVGLGSDFDGATIPKGIADVAGLPALQQAMLDHQYGEALMKKLCSENWLKLLDHDPESVATIKPIKGKKNARPTRKHVI